MKRTEQERLLKRLLTQLRKYVKAVGLAPRKYELVFPMEENLPVQLNFGDHTQVTVALDQEVEGLPVFTYRAFTSEGDEAHLDTIGSHRIARAAYRVLRTEFDQRMSELRDTVQADIEAENEAFAKQPLQEQAQHLEKEVALAFRSVNYGPHSCVDMG